MSREPPKTYSFCCVSVKLHTSTSGPEFGDTEIKKNRPLVERAHPPHGWTDTSFFLLIVLAKKCCSPVFRQITSPSMWTFVRVFCARSLHQATGQNFFALLQRGLPFHSSINKLGQPWKRIKSNQSKQDGIMCSLSGVSDLLLRQGIRIRVEGFVQSFSQFSHSFVCSVQFRQGLGVVKKPEDRKGDTELLVCHLVEV